MRSRSAWTSSSSSASSLSAEAPCGPVHVRGRAPDQLAVGLADRSIRAVHDHVALADRHGHGVTGVVRPADMLRSSSRDPLRGAVAPRSTDKSVVGGVQRDDANPAFATAAAADERKRAVGVLEHQDVVDGRMIGGCGRSRAGRVPGRRFGGEWKSHPIRTVARGLLGGPSPNRRLAFPRMDAAGARVGRSIAPPGRSRPRPSR